LLNIGLNARDAMPDGGVLSVRARNLGRDENGLEPAGQFVLIDIQDTGIGMSPEVRGRAFEPFFTTKDVGRGSGLGLSQAYGFAEQSGGSVGLDSSVGKGTQVTLRLPAASASQAYEPVERDTVLSRPTGNSTVLLVEDDAAVAELALGLLQGAGYEVKTATNAADALKVLRNGARIDLVFSDIVMPGGMNGADLARVIRAEFPSVFILLATGYAEAAAAAAREFPLIRKPYGRDNLIGKVSEIIGEAVV